MELDVDGTKILKHHEKQELCTTRPAYREGRDLKAVKVYSIAQESKYLLVQGVPAVGATSELIKVFALYGEILEYRILDEYPTEDNYTEVYWIKFKRIQSARFAKKKLDDYAFFGGVLHICYAPEYETVEETREKLKERRREVAVRVRKLGETSGKQSSSVSFLQQTESDNVSETLQDTNSSTATNVTPHLDISQSDAQTHQNMVKNTEVQDDYQQRQVREENPLGEGQQADVSHAVPPFLPPPPLMMPRPSPWGPPLQGGHYHPHPPYPSMHPEGRYAMGSHQYHRYPQGGHDVNSHPGPSGHPPSMTAQRKTDLDAKDEQLGEQNLRDQIHKKKVEKNDLAGQSFKSNTHGIKNDKFVQLQDSIGQRHDQKTHNNTLSNNRLQSTQPTVNNVISSTDVVVRDFKPKTVSTPRFVPRQTIKRIKEESKQNEIKEDSNSVKDPLNEELRRNACILGSVKGPNPVHGERTKRLDEEQQSLDKTRKAIRDKVKSFSTPLPLPIPKKKRKTETGS